MNSSNKAWERLVNAAQVRGGREEGGAAPSGFATRVVALAWSAQRESESLFERFSWRALGTACAVALVCVSLNVSTTATAGTTPGEEELLQTDAVVAQLLENS